MSDSKLRTSLAPPAPAMSLAVTFTGPAPLSQTQRIHHIRPYAAPEGKIDEHACKFCSLAPARRPPSHCPPHALSFAWAAISSDVRKNGIDRWLGLDTASP